LREGGFIETIKARWSEIKHSHNEVTDKIKSKQHLNTRLNNQYWLVKSVIFHKTETSGCVLCSKYFFSMWDCDDINRIAKYCLLLTLNNRACDAKGLEFIAVSKLGPIKYLIHVQTFALSSIFLSDRYPSNKLSLPIVEFTSSSTIHSAYNLLA
jgi:hypothetical protein